MIYPKKKFDKVKFGKIDETNVSKNKLRRKPVLVMSRNCNNIDKI